ncbi:MAG: HprK-related kinase A [Chromatocurvus sp.]
MTGDKPVLVGDLAPAALAGALSRGLCFRTGPFYTRVTSGLRAFAGPLQRCYASLPVLPDSQIAHFSVTVCRRPGLRARLRPQADFLFEGVAPFDPYPLSQAFPMFEWGLNWCIATTAHQYLMLHSAVVERHGRALVLPAQPGSGKSTLCAALVGRGWRLLSDEFGMLRLADGQLQPLPRAAPLKNASIDVIRAFAPDLSFGPRYDKTRKGTVVHLFPPAESLQRQGETCPPGAVVFPRYVADAPTRLVSQPPIAGITRLVNNSFNYLVSGEAGFVALCELVRTAGCYELTYSRLDEAIGQLDALLGGSGPVDESGREAGQAGTATSQASAGPPPGMPA